jgi:RNA-directed DNA polymerase
LRTSKALTRDDGIQRIDKYPALGENLLKRVLTKENMSRAWKRVRDNKGSPGIDGITVEEFPEHYRPKWEEIIHSLRSGTYQPKPVKRVIIEKEGGGERLLGIPCVIDRLIQQAIYQILLPLFNPYFSDYSYGFRPERSQHEAIRQVEEYVKKGYKIAVDVDLSKFFDTINHDYLMSILGQRIKDKALLKLIGKYLRAGIFDKGNFIESREGVPQGSPLSPLLSNIVLDKLDKELEKRGHKFARYADDFIILVKSKRAGERVLTSITRFVEKNLKLKVNGQKSKVVPVEESKFLGFTFKGKRIAVHPKAIGKFNRQVRFLTGRSWGVSMEVKIKELTQYLRGWMNYFGIAVPYQTSIDLDQWIRRRVRMCYWKQWHRPRTRVRNLIALGVSEKLAITCGATSKGYWRGAKTEGIQIALNNKLLMEQGLISLRDIWISLRYG